MLENNHDRKKEASWIDMNWIAWNISYFDTDTFLTDIQFSFNAGSYLTTQAIEGVMTRDCVMKPDSSKTSKLKENFLKMVIKSATDWSYVSDVLFYALKQGRIQGGTEVLELWTSLRQLWLQKTKR